MGREYSQFLLINLSLFCLFQATKAKQTLWEMYLIKALWKNCRPKPKPSFMFSHMKHEVALFQKVPTEYDCVKDHTISNHIYFKICDGTVAYQEAQVLFYARHNQVEADSLCFKLHKIIRKSRRSHARQVRLAPRKAFFFLTCCFGLLLKSLKRIMYSKQLFAHRHFPIFYVFCRAHPPKSKRPQQKSTSTCSFPLGLQRETMRVQCHNQGPTFLQSPGPKGGWSAAQPAQTGISLWSQPCFHMALHSHSEEEWMEATSINKGNTEERCHQSAGANPKATPYLCQPRLATKSQRRVSLRSQYFFLHFF